MCDLTWQRDYVGVIRDLEMGGDPGLSGWAQCQHRILTEGNSECETMCDDGSRDGSEVIPGRGYEPRNVGTSGSWKRRSRGSPRASREPALDLGSGNSFWPLTFRTGR